MDIINDIKGLFCTYRIGNITEKPVSVTGGLLHKMYKVTAKADTYAVKCLNPSIMQRSGVMANMINSELIAKAFSKHLPTVAALSFEGHTVLPINKRYYMVYNWIEGVSVFPPDVSNDNCRKIGSALGKIHSMDITVPDVARERSKPDIYDWQQYSVKGKEQNASWLPLYSNMIEKLIIWNNKSNYADKELSEYMVISHRDMDPKNVLWQDDMPYFIDWEAAGYVNPYRELLEVLNYWADSGGDELDKAKFNILLNAYRESMNTKAVNWDCVLASGYAGMLGWLEYSLRRALGIESKDENERRLGARQIIDTMTELERYDMRMNAIRIWLNE